MLETGGFEEFEGGICPPSTIICRHNFLYSGDRFYIQKIYIYQNIYTYILINIYIYICVSISLFIYIYTKLAMYVLQLHHADAISCIVVSFPSDFEPNGNQFGSKIEKETVTFHSI